MLFIYRNTITWWAWYKRDSKVIFARLLVSRILGIISRSYILVFIAWNEFQACWKCFELNHFESESSHLTFWYFSNALHHGINDLLFSTGAEWNLLTFWATALIEDCEAPQNNRVKQQQGFLPWLFVVNFLLKWSFVPC